MRLTVNLGMLFLLRRASLVYSSSVEQLGRPKGSFMGLLRAGSFYYGQHAERQKQLPREAVDLIFFKPTFFLSWPLSKSLCWPASLWDLLLGRSEMPF